MTETIDMVDFNENVDRILRTQDPEEAFKIMSIIAATYFLVAVEAIGQEETLRRSKIILDQTKNGEGPLTKPLNSEIKS